MVKKIIASILKAFWSSLKNGTPPCCLKSQMDTKGLVWWFAPMTHLCVGLTPLQTPNLALLHKKHVPP